MSNYNTLTRYSKEHSRLEGKLLNDTAQYRRRIESLTIPMRKLITSYFNA